MVLRSAPLVNSSALQLVDLNLSQGIRLRLFLQIVIRTIPFGYVRIILLDLGVARVL